MTKTPNLVETRIRSMHNTVKSSPQYNMVHMVQKKHEHAINSNPKLAPAPSLRFPVP